MIFEHEGKQFQGTCTQDSSGGSNVDHLMFKNFYYGQLVKLPDGAWRFNGSLKTGDLEKLRPLFGQQIESYLSRVSTGQGVSR